MPSDDEQQNRGFKVQDRRRFAGTEPGDEATRDEPPRPEPSSAAADAAATFGTGAGATSDAGTAHGDPSAPPSASATDEAPFGEMSFSTFVMGLTTQALMHLGEIADPVHQAVRHDLPAAKQMIDLLGILREKTKGNLDAAEEQLLGEVLYDLRMRYVEVARTR
jgi:hypothetical protein